MVKQIEMSPNRFLIEGDSIQELLDYCLPKIRNLSKKFYEKEILADLEKQKHSWIDYHAGISNYYKIVLI